MILVITSDTDFVSDGILSYAYSTLTDTPCTFFVTGNSDFVATTMSQNKLWEVEPHPNFIDGSTHGNSIGRVFDTVNSFKVNGAGFRCHRYFFSNDVAERFADIGYKYSSNVCTDLQCVPPFKTRYGLMEFPIFFEDGGFLKYHGTPNFERVLDRMNNPDGIYVFNFHPIHIALNSCDFTTSRALKDTLSYEQYRALSMQDVFKVRNSKQYGMSDFLNDLLRFAAVNNIRMLHLKQLYEELQDYHF